MRKDAIGRRNMTGASRSPNSYLMQFNDADVGLVEDLHRMIRNHWANGQTLSNDIVVRAIGATKTYEGRPVDFLTLIEEAKINN